MVTELGIDILQLRAVQEWVMGHRNGRQRWLMVAVPVTPLRSITEGGLPLRGLGRTFGLESARWGGGGGCLWLAALIVEIDNDKYDLA